MTGTESEIPRQLMIEETRLARAYSVQEVAMIAAGCIGDSPDARIEEALDLLSAAERHALRDKWEKHRDWNVEHGHPEDIEPERKFVENNERRWLKAEQICSDAKRDDKTGKIERTSLVTLAYKESGIGTDSPTANRHYKDWLKSAAIEDARDLPLEVMHERLGSPPWGQGKLDELSRERVSSASGFSFKARFESGEKLVLIHDDKTAKDLAFAFLGWLEARPKKTPSKVIRSDKDKKYVSPEDRGADRADGTEKGVAKSGKPRKPGQFKPPKSPVADVEEHASPPNRK